MGRWQNAKIRKKLFPVIRFVERFHSNIILPPKTPDHAIFSPTFSSYFCASSASLQYNRSKIFIQQFILNETLTSALISSRRRKGDEQRESERERESRRTKDLFKLHLIGYSNRFNAAEGFYFLSAFSFLISRRTVVANGNANFVCQRLICTSI